MHELSVCQALVSQLETVSAQNGGGHVLRLAPGSIVVDAATHEWLLANPGARLVVDVENTTITLPDGNTCKFELDDFARYCLVEGTDQLGFLQRQLDQIETFEEMRPWKP